jgi:nucleotide-binding universal stress UspA family protein
VDDIESTTNKPLVVCCTDGSGESSHAIATGLRLLPPGSYQPILVQVIPPIAPQMVAGIDTGMSLGAYADVDVVEQHRQHQEKVTSSLESMMAQLALEDGGVKVLTGSPSHAIRDFAEDEAAAMIIVGRQGMGAVDRLIMGSVSQYLVRKAPCPVLVVGGEAATHGGGPALLATDDSSQAHLAARLATSVLSPDLALQAVTVSGKAPVVGDDGLAELRARAEQGEGVEVDAHLKLDLNGRTAQSVVLYGQPAEALVDYASEVDAATIVMGTHGRGGLLRVVLGSVASDVLAKATCPVFIAGPHCRT